ncbi:MAG: efflux RND transporter permease subunit [Pseudomonadota bacterium]
MIAQTIQWSLRFRLFVIAGAAILFGWGVYESMRSPVDVFPELTAPSVTVVTEAHNMAPEEVERLVTYPVETALNGSTGVRRLRSSTGVGISVVTVEFDWGTDIYRARQVVSEKLQSVRGELPPGAGEPTLAPVTSVMGEVMFLAVTGDADPMTLRTAADWQVRRRLQAVPGVAEVITIGGDIKQYEVRVQPERLAAHDIAVNEVADAVRSTNRNVSAGFYVDNGRELLIHGSGRVTGAEEIGNTVIQKRDGQPIKVRDVAEVSVGPAPVRGTGSRNGEDAAVLGVKKQPGENTLALTQRLDREIESLREELPDGVTLRTDLFRQADFIDTAVNNLLEALRDGGILVVAIVMLFLVSFRASALSLLAIPLSLIAAVLALRALGGTLNTMTLGGLAIAIGAVVDDAIIVVENIVRRLRGNAALPEHERLPPEKVVGPATVEIQGSIVFATFIIMLVFTPLFFLPGIEGRLMGPLGFAYIVALGASLLVAITVTPALASLILPNSRTVQKAKEPRLVERTKAAFAPILDATLHRWKLVAGLAVLGLAGASLALSLAGQSFLPEFNEGSLTVSAVTKPGTALEESDRLGGMVEDILLSHPEVTSTARRTGRAEQDPHAQAVYASEIDVSLDMGDRSKSALLKELREELSAVPGTNIVIGQPLSHRIDHMLSGTRANLAVKLFGPELDQLRRLSKEVEGAMESVPGIVDLTRQPRAQIPFLSVDFKRDAIARHGLRVEQVAEAMRTAFTGETVSRVMEDQTAFDLVLRLPPSAKQDRDTIRELSITTPDGARVPLHALADIRETRGPNTIMREDVARKMIVSANVDDPDLVGVVRDAQQRVSDEVELPKGYRIEYGGQFEAAQEASSALFWLGLAVLAGIFLLLYVAFNSVRDAVLVMINLPLALIGGVAGLFVAGGILSIATMIGFIALLGIATRNGVMLVSHIHTLREQEGESAVGAVRRGTLERLIPILMTALSAGLGLVPLAMGAGEPGSEIQAPMAMVILFGLLSSTVLNMVVLPALYLRFGSAVRSPEPGGQG